MREHAVADEQRDVVLAGGQVEGVFARVAKNAEADQAGVGVEAVNAHGVVVVPERGGVLLEG